MIKIGLCGSSGSGKSCVCQKLEEYGIKWIDTDKVYRELVTKDSECLNELVECFGKDILKENGELDRTALSKKVFEESRENLKKLNEISHKHIKTKTLELMDEYEAQGYKGVTIDAPVLFESGFDKLCDITVCVIAPYELKIKRIINRDGITRDKAISRLNNQLSDNELIALCNYKIENSNDNDLDKQIEAFIKATKIV